MNKSPIDLSDAARRAYWTEQMELGSALVEELIAFPVEEGGESLASLREAAAVTKVEMLFSGTKIAGELERVFYLRRSLVHDVMTIAREMNQRGWILKIEDGFRSLEMQSSLVRKPAVFDAVLKKCLWENGGSLPSAEMIFRRALIMVANIPKIGTHMSGSAIDISVFHRDDGREVWRGNPYLDVSESTPMNSPYLSVSARENRRAITAVMEKHGFVHFPFEFWHYNQGDALAHILTNNPAPCRYGAVNWNPGTNEVTAVVDTLTPLNPLPVIQIEIAAAMARARAI